MKVDYSTTLSDHFPIICVIGRENTKKVDSQLPYKLNSSHRKTPSRVCALVGIWNSIPKLEEEDSYREWWQAAITQCADFLCSFGERLVW